MKTTLLFFISVIAFAGCTNTDQVKRITDLANKDSVMLVQANQKDSDIAGYMHELSQIQDNLDRIKAREKIITRNSPENKLTMVAQIKELDEWIVLNDKKMNALQGKLKKMTVKNTDLENMVTHLTQDIADRDAEIVTLQDRLSCANDSVKSLTSNFNDSILVINRERSIVSNMTAEMNTVYYVSGTMKELKDKGVVDKQGGFLGIGRSAKVHSEINNSNYMQADLTSLKGFGLNGKFKKMITAQPDNSYTVIPTGKTDSISINMPSTFWSESKYLVVALK